MKNFLLIVEFALVTTFILGLSYLKSEHIKYEEVSPETNEILVLLQEHSEKISVLEKQATDLLERNDLTTIKLEETFQVVFCLLGEIKWLMNNNAPTNLIIDEEIKD